MENENKKTHKKKTKPRKNTSLTVPYRFPKNSLEEALKLAKAIEEKFAGNPTKAIDLVKAVGFNKASDWRFADLLKSGALYGLTHGSGASATIRLEKLGEDIVSPSSPEQRQKALLSAFRNVEDFKNAEDFYKGKKIPEDEFFENTLIRSFNIPRDRVGTFIKVFLENLTFLKAFRASDGQSVTTSNIPTPIKELGEPEKTTSVREFLDTCFVMMPFGKWFDLYYEKG